MDGHRFDDLTRSLAGLSRRRLLAGLTGALLGGAASQLDERGANAACPSRQVYRQRVPSGGGCVCVATGRPPTNRAGTCPCPGGQTDCGGTCVDLSSNRLHCGACGSPCRRPDRCSTATCDAGVCTIAVIARDCPASDQCHDLGACDPATGTCTNPAKADGTPCDDGNACTRADTCQGGVCTGFDPVVCTARDQCHIAGAGDPAPTGACSDPLKPDGSSCDDSNPCTQIDTCRSGVCVGSVPVQCAPPDQCRLAGVCDTATGGCAARTQARRTRLRRRERLLPDGHLPERILHGVGSVPRRRRLQSCERRVLEPEQGQRLRLQRRQRLHADGHVPDRRVHGEQPHRLHGLGPMSRRGHVQPRQRRVLEPEQGQRLRVQRRKRLHAERYVPVGVCAASVRPGRLRGVGPVPRCRRLQSRERRVLEPARGRRLGLRRWESDAHRRRPLPGRSVRRRRSGGLLHAGNVSSRTMWRGPRRLRRHPLLRLPERPDLRRRRNAQRLRLHAHLRGQVPW